MDYTKKLQELLYQKEESFPKDTTDYEKCILYLRKQKCTYSQIQKTLGNPSKKEIRAVLLKYDPDLIYLDTNTQKLQSSKDPIENRITGLLEKQSSFKLEEFGNSKFFIKNNHISFYDEDDEEYNLLDFDERTKQSILKDILKQLNITF